MRRTLAKPGPLTLEGTIFIVLAFLIGLAAMNTGTNLLYLIFSLMMAFILVSGLLSSRTLKKLSVQRSLPKHIVAGEPVDVRITVQNGKRWFSSYGLEVSDRMRDRIESGYCYFLRVPPKEHEAVSYPCLFHRRGFYRFAQLVITTTYPFGLVRRLMTVRAERDILVYPQILPWHQLGLETPPDFGERDSRRKGPGTSLYGLREQQPTEGARWIHWKKTAQTGRLMRREFEAEEKKNVCLVLDNALRRPDDPETREAFERAVVLTASVAHHLLRQDHQVELLTRSGRVPYNTGPHQRYRILRALALIEPVEADGRAPLAASVRGDVATVIFRCEGQGSSASYPRGTQVYVVSSPSRETITVRPSATRPEAVA
ncbi:MAG: hypothetical protein AMJ84_10190 [Acidithiobacillales bacterium SM23_46]|nr:MAG: hypothetical protein AMJ84_10190 [Acidithiobacillales bacterium SM23_46]